MSTTTTIQAHIAYELIDDHEPDVVVIEFLSHEIASSFHSRELGEQLDSLIRPDLPQSFVIDFGNVRSLGSTAFGEIASFAHKVGGLTVFNMPESLRLGAALIGLDLCAEFAANRQAAIDEARRTGLLFEEYTMDDSESCAEPPEAAVHASGSRRSKTLESNKHRHSFNFGYEEVGAGDRAGKVKKHTAAVTALTLDDFGGRSDALGG
jgi:anti-anti-sigma regulatory factor